MSTFVQTFQTILPLELYGRLGRLRSRYAAALLAAGKGDYTYSEDMRAVGRAVGSILAAEARKDPAERGGLHMLDLSLAVDSFFPELRCWTQNDLLQYQKERLIRETFLRPPSPAKVSASRAS